MPLTRPRLPFGLTAPSGAWQAPSNLNSIAAAAPTAGTAYWMPIDIGPLPMTIQSLGVQCTTAQVAGTVTYRLGLYADDLTGGAPLLTAAGLLGEGTFTATPTGTKTVALSLTLAPGRYWAAYLHTVASAPTTAAQFNCVQGVGAILWTPNGTALGSSLRALGSNSQTALPTAAVTYTPIAANVAPAVFVRAA